MVDPHEGQDRDLERIERDLANARAAVSALESERESWKQAAAEARQEYLQAWAYGVAGLGGLAFVIGVIIFFVGSRKLGWTLILSGLGTLAAALTLSWALPWLIAAAPYLGAGLLLAVGYAVWKQHRVAKEAARFGDKVKEVVKEDLPEKWLEIEEWATKDQTSRRVNKELKRLRERLKKEN